MNNWTHEIFVLSFDKKLCENSSRVDNRFGIERHEKSQCLLDMQVSSIWIGFLLEVEEDQDSPLGFDSPLDFVRNRFNRLKRR